MTDKDTAILSQSAHLYCCTPVLLFSEHSLETLFYWVNIYNIDLQFHPCPRVEIFSKELYFSS